MSKKPSVLFICVKNSGKSQVAAGLMRKTELSKPRIARTIGPMHDSYMAFIPADLRPDPDLRPESTWWRWHDSIVHIERVRRPDAAARMLLLHGGGGHAAVVWPFAAMAVERGFEVMVPDLPGYGRTEVRSDRRVRYSDWVDCAADVVRAEKTDDARPLVVFGASMGGMLAYEAAARTGLAAAVVATCLLDPRLPQARAAIGRYSWMGRHGARLLSPVADGLRVPMRLVANMAAMSNDPALAGVVLRDSRGGGVRMPLGFLRTYLQSVPVVEPEGFNACPVWLVHPGADQWTPLAVSRVFFDRIAAPKHLLVLDNAGHYPIETPGIGQLADALADLRDQVVSDPGSRRAGEVRT